MSMEPTNRQQPIAEQRLTSRSPVEPGRSTLRDYRHGPVTGHLQTVIEAAERAADAIRADAEAQARRHLTDAQQKADRLTAERLRQIAEVTDELIEHATVVKEHSESMVAALERAISAISDGPDDRPLTAEDSDAGDPTPELNVAADSAPAQGPVPVAPPVQIEEVPSEPASAESEQVAGRSTGDADTREPDEPPIIGAQLDSGPGPRTAALLRATQMAISGSDRETVGATIWSEFGIDPSRVLDQVFAAG